MIDTPTRRVAQTARLVLCRITEDDAPFLVRLLNQPSFVRFIGDKGVRTLDEAREYVRASPEASYAQHGFGLYLVVRREDGAPLGICGLVKREVLADPDLGFAFLAEFWSQGYAFEAASAVLRHARDTLGLPRVVAVTTPDNERSAHLLRKLGLRHTRMVRLSPEEGEIRLFEPDPSAATVC